MANQRNQRRDPNKRPAKIGKVLLSKDGEEFFNQDGQLCQTDTTDWDCPDYPSWYAAKACRIADKAILKMCLSASKSDKSK